LKLLEGWWFDSKRIEESGNLVLDRDTEMLPCLNVLACLPNEQVGETAYIPEVNCADGYLSVICGACDSERGYLRSGELCRKCESFWTNVAIVSATAAVLLGYVLYVVGFQSFSAAAGDNRPVVLKILMCVSGVV
jgi:hypothetical protein|tara:strand:- start:23 stop:427 length:405 start_codon:yes stop_codon:yes gene_type:complete